MRHAAFCGAIALVFGSMQNGLAQAPTTALAPQPTTITMEQLNDIGKLDGQLIHIPTVQVRHSDTAQVFTFSGTKGREIHVLIPSPAIDAARVGDSVAVAGRVRRFDAKAFESDYKWFRQADYPDVHGGDWVVIATSVRTQEGTELVPGNTISNAPPGVKATSGQK